MLQQPEKPDISLLVDYLRWLGRASGAGTAFGVITLSWFASIDSLIQP